MGELSFKKGELVVYPAHGVGVVNGIETQDIGGVHVKLVVISFEKDKMILRLPLNKSTSSKVRKLSSKEDMQEAIKRLRTPTRVKKMMWSRRAQEYEMKINTGDPISIAQVVRDLHRNTNQPEHSYSEHQIYQEAMSRLMKEYAAVAKIDEQSAKQELEAALNAA
ncbi:MAG: CarD family transcriptional regulator [Holosporaceae bacterium]|jgi:CarD family transcriptional regulator|nr:CarD family transcriptional regulator [Holosporaceae bacterium]